MIDEGPLAPPGNSFVFLHVRRFYVVAVSDHSSFRLLAAVNGGYDDLR